MVVNRLYYKKDAPCFKNEGGSFSFNNKALEEAIRSIFEKELNVSSEIDRGLFNEFWRIFNEAADSGFGVPPVTSPEYMFYEEIKYNNAVYSAFRTHRLQNDIAAQMLDDDGKLKDFRQFKTDVESLVAPTHLDAWLETEYDTAVLRAHLAADWHQFEQNKDILPNLRWVPSTSVEPGLDHRMFWNIIRPVDDAFWDNHRPGDRWNCKCDLEATDEPATDKSDIPQARDSDKPKDGLENNPGKDAKLFSENNPYQKHAYPGARKAVDRFVNENIHRPEEKTFQSVQKYKNGGEVLLHPEVNREVSDFKALMNIAKDFASKGEIASVTPSLHFKSAEYSRIYGALEGTKYWKKCPDLKIGEHFYEFEGFVKPWTKKKVSRMLSHGLEQSSRIIIDNNKGASDRYIKKLIYKRLHIKVSIEEVWVYEKGKVRLLFKKAEP